MDRPLEILLVEDNPGDARLLQELLRDAGLPGARLHRVETLRTACEHLRDLPTDVVLLDLSLPDAHGFETVAGAIEAAPEIPIIVLTGLDDESVALQAVQSGAQDYLVKGRVEPSLLGRSIRYAIERKQVAREREVLLGAEQEARRSAEGAVQARDQVLRVVSHDLGNHLAAIRINAMVLARTVGDQSATAENRVRADGILQQVAVMDRLRQDLLDAASIQAGRLSLARSQVDPAALLAAVAELARPMAAEKSVRIVIQDDGRLSGAYADPDRLLQALGNLVGNAIKFTPKGGAVALSCDRHAEQLVFAVTDDGPGVDADDVDRIFDSFWKSQQGNPGGAGLGLSIVKGIAEAHGGRAWYEPAAGRGSTFRFAVPIGEA